MQYHNLNSRIKPLLNQGYLTNGKANRQMVFAWKKQDIICDTAMWNAVIYVDERFCSNSTLIN